MARQKTTPLKRRRKDGRIAKTRKKRIFGKKHAACKGTKIRRVTFRCMLPAGGRKKRTRKKKAKAGFGPGAMVVYNPNAPARRYRNGLLN